ncbi:hypothetical protein K492DRAFT_200271 [Lichtheimia hyalospora FSU 10163]|nr:hypothetical protein K492DRAFT_200271 [Lichtheimia hyalospora FSU 10163]
MHSLLVRRAISARSTMLARSYSATAPAVPLQHQEFTPKDQDTHNTIHALYNTENQSMLDHHAFSSSSSSQQVHSVASEYSPLTHSSDCFSPTFNTVFDE